MNKLVADQGLLYYLIQQRRPELASRISQTKEIETMIVGLGNQGTRHAGLMMEYGTNIACGVAPGRGGTRVHETVPVYDTASDALEQHPNIAVASIWRHYSTAKDATIEVIRAGVPVIVLISEFIPLRDVRDILVEARKHKTLLFGGNTPGIIFPPENIKIGMLPNIFQAEEKGAVTGPKGVTIISRSGAILYHLSDALASEGIAQNAVFGIGGDGAIGSRFVDLVSLVMGYENTDLVVIAGEIGGMQEELLAQDMQAHPEKYPKPLVALISGANAPEGKTMGHAGAVVAPGQTYGTHLSKKTELEKAGVTVVNHQRDLIAEVKSKIEGKSYFEIDEYYQKMSEKWDAKPPQPTWGTIITNVLPNNLLIRGYPLQELIERKQLLDVTHLLDQGEFPNMDQLKRLASIAVEGAKEAGPQVSVDTDSDLSKTLGTFLLLDQALKKYSQTAKNTTHLIAYTLGRVARYSAMIFNNENSLNDLPEDISFGQLIYRALVGEKNPDPAMVRLLEAMITACVDHGVTPPSAQATLILASTRAAYEVALSGGVHAITDVHGGAGQKAAEFFLDVVAKSKVENILFEDATFNLMRELIKKGQRIEGLGHRIHTQDPRRDVLWKFSEDSGLAKDCVAVSKLVSEEFYRVRGMNLPINVDGVIGAIVADMGLNPALSKLIFIYGRIAGLAAHYFEEINTQTQMRRIAFDLALYKGAKLRSIS
ncbi:MAG: citrate/2-methylcitrate synthase [Candidatus Kariarchaeaceae archaeon]|jgi:succinyl-CoA synthetase alpha subunit